LSRAGGAEKLVRLALGHVQGVDQGHPHHRGPLAFMQLVYSIHVYSYGLLLKQQFRPHANSEWLKALAASSDKATGCSAEGGGETVTVGAGCGECMHGCMNAQDTGCDVRNMATILSVMRVAGCDQLS